METHKCHKVDIIQSSSGVGIYSTLEYGRSISHRSSQFDNFLDLKTDRMWKTIKGHEIHKFTRVLSGVEAAGILTTSTLLFKDVISPQLIDTGTSVNADLVGVLTAASLYALTKLSQQVNIHKWKIAAHEFEAIKVAEKENIPQLQMIFPHPTQKG